MTTDPTPTMQYTHVNGKHQCDDGYVVLIASQIVGRDKWKRLEAEVVAAISQTGNTLHRSRIDLLSQSKCSEFATKCAQVDGQYDYEVPLRFLTENIVRWVDANPHGAQEDRASHDRDSAYDLDVASMDDVQPEAVEWLWYPYIPRGSLTMLDGEPGVGKSLFTTHLAAIVSRGGMLPDQFGQPTFSIGASQRALLFAGEDSVSATVRPRLDDAMADCSMIDLVMGEKASDGSLKPFTLGDVEKLERYLQTKPYAIAVLDPIQLFLGSKVNMNQANETRPLLEGLRKVAERYHLAIICVRHPAKSGSGSSIHRGIGSIDFIGAARSGLFVEQHLYKRDRVFLGHTKANLSAKGRTQVFSKTKGVFAWQGVTRATDEFLFGSWRGPDPQALWRAFFWLEETLSGGLGWPEKDIVSRAEECDISEKSLRRAKSLLQVKSTMLKDDKGVAKSWVWRLPDIEYDDSLSLSILPGPLGHLGHLDHLGHLGHVGNNKELEARIENTVLSSCPVILGGPDSPDDPDGPHGQVGQVPSRGGVESEGFSFIDPLLTRQPPRPTPPPVAAAATGLPADVLDDEGWSL